MSDRRNTAALAVLLLAVAGSGCSIHAQRCGDGDRQSAEVCDDGNTVSGDGCNATCSNYCGDGVEDPAEACDDGNYTDGDGCTAACTPEICGDMFLDFGEACDDGNTISGDGCSADCRKFEQCGDSVLDVGEVCDDGGLAGGCTDDCMNLCGDSILGPIEACDDGGTADGDGCRADCLGVEDCGDGLLDVGEWCDDGNAALGDGCDAGCDFDLAATCGDGTAQQDEFCPGAAVVTIEPDVAHLALADLDGDTVVDVAATSSGLTGRLALFRGAGDGTLVLATEAPPTGDARELTLANLDLDGDLDVVIPNYSQVVTVTLDGLAVVASQSIGGSAGTIQVRVGSFDQVAPADLVAAGTNLLSVFLLSTMGGNQYSYMGGATAIAVGDADGDGDDDIYAAQPEMGGTSSLMLLRNDGPGMLTTLPLGTGNPPIDRLALVDLVGGPLPDLLVGGPASARLGLNPGTGLAVDLTPIGLPGTSLVAGDLDGDGDTDLVSIDAVTRVLHVAMNDGAGGFAARRGLHLGVDALELALADMTGDGVLDVVLVEAGVTPETNAIRVLPATP